MVVDARSHGRGDPAHLADRPDAFVPVIDRLHDLARSLQPFFLEEPPNLYARGWARCARVGVFRRFRHLSGDQLSDLVRFATARSARSSSAISRPTRYAGSTSRTTSTGCTRRRTCPARRSACSSTCCPAARTCPGLLRPRDRRDGLDHPGDGGGGPGGGGGDPGVVDGCARRGPGRARDRGLLEDGTELDAKVVLSNADPKRTFLGLVESPQLAGGVPRRRRGDQDGRPVRQGELRPVRGAAWTGMPADADANRRSLATLVPTLEEAQRIYDRHRGGEIPDELWVDCVTASNVDETLAPPGDARHDGVRAVRALRAPTGHLGRTARRAAAQGRGDDRALRATRRPGTIGAAQVLTPLDLERTYGLTEGNIFHGDLHIGQLFSMRPLPAWSRYRTPIEGLYLCGAGAHPGGGVTGAPGYGASHAALRDLRDGGARGAEGSLPQLRVAPVTEFALGGELRPIEAARRRGRLRAGLPPGERRGSAGRALVPRARLPDVVHGDARHDDERDRMTTGRLRFERTRDPGRGRRHGRVGAVPGRRPDVLAVAEVPPPPGSVLRDRRLPELPGHGGRRAGRPVVRHPGRERHARRTRPRLALGRPRRAARDRSRCTR